MTFSIPANKYCFKASFQAGILLKSNQKRQEHMIEFPLEPLSINQVWRKSLDLWRLSIKQILLPVFIWILLLLLPNIFLYLVPLGNAWWWIFPLLIISSVCAVILSSSMFLYMHKKMIGAAIPFNQAFTIALQKSGQLTAAFFISAIVLGVSLLLLFPGIYLLVFFWFYFPIIMIDDLGPIAALEESFKIVRGHWWKTAIVIGLPMLVLTLVTLWIEYPSFGVGISRDIIFNPMLDWSIQHYAKFVLAFIYLPFFIAMVTVQLQNLKLQYSKEFVENLPDRPLTSGITEEAVVEIK